MKRGGRERRRGWRREGNSVQVWGKPACLPGIQKRGKSATRMVAEGKKVSAEFSAEGTTGPVCLSST